jgi:hypothetical protein
MIITISERTHSERVAFSDNMIITISERTHITGYTKKLRQL